MGEVVLRAPTLDDVEAAVRCMNSESRRLRGRDDVAVREVRGWWTQPAPFALEDDAVLALEGGEVVGYGDIGDPAHDGMALWLDVRGDAKPELLAELERRALLRRAVDGVVRAVADATDHDYRALLAGRGYVEVRSSYRMLVEFDEPPPAVIWPAGTSVRTAVGGVEEPLLHELNMRSFADHWGFAQAPFDEWHHWLTELGEPDPSLWFVAEAEGEPVGLCLCRSTRHGDPDCGWVSVLGVLPAARGRGVGSALLRHAFRELHGRGRVRVGLGVDAENTSGAVGLYERAGMRVIERHDSWELRR